MLNTKSKAKASDYGSMGGQKRAPRIRAIQSQAVYLTNHCDGGLHSSDMMTMINIFQHIKTKERQRECRRDRQTDCICCALC